MLSTPIPNNLPPTHPVGFALASIGVLFSTSFHAAFLMVALWKRVVVTVLTLMLSVTVFGNTVDHHVLEAEPKVCLGRGVFAQLSLARSK